MSDPEPGALRILHLSDTHLFGDGTRHYGVVDTTAALRRVLERAHGLADLDAVVVSGDLSDDGSEASYRTLRSLVDPWAAARGAEVLYVMGNHDGRSGFEAVIGPRVGVTTVRGVRLVRLDSSVPGYGYGRLDASQLGLLREELATPAPHGTIVILHHPPTPARTPLLHALELQNPGDLLEVCAGTDVRAVLGGHYHHALATAERGIPVIVAPGITNTTCVTCDDGHERSHVGSGFAVVELPSTEGAAPSVAFVTAPSPEDGTELFDLGPDEVDAIAAKAGPQA